MLPNSVKSNGLRANNVRPYGYARACGLHAVRRGRRTLRNALPVIIMPTSNSHPPNPDFHRRTPPARRTRTDTPAIPFSRRVNRPSARCRSAMPPSSGGTGSRLNSPSSALAPASRYAPSGFASAVSAKLAAGSGEADGGARKRRRRQAAPQDSAAGGQAQGVHRAAGQPNDEKMSALMYSRRQQENGQHAALIRAPEHSHEHKKAVADLNPAHSAR